MNDVVSIEKLVRNVFQEVELSKGNIVRKPGFGRDVFDVDVKTFCCYEIWRAIGDVHRPDTGAYMSEWEVSRFAGTIVLSNTVPSHDGTIVPLITRWTYRSIRPRPPLCDRLLGYVDREGDHQNWSLSARAGDAVLYQVRPRHSPRYARGIMGGPGTWLHSILWSQGSIRLT